MLSIITLSLLALAVSLDGFGAGVMYGLRKIRIPLFSIFIISVCSGMIIYTSMNIGVLLLRWISMGTARNIGAAILIVIGIWAVVQIFMQKQAETARVHPEPKSVKIEFKSLGVVIEILKVPAKADMDRSGNISALEATLLGIALSLDAFAAGLGAALVGFSPWMTSLLIAFSSGFFLAMGLRVGFIFSNLRWVKKLNVLPGIILIIMGIMKLF